jgi:DNA transposition AAA+ family ATPase
MITETQKREIADHLQKFVLSCKSQAAAASQLKNVSDATLSQINAGKWKDISDQMWLNIGKQIGWGAKRIDLVETQDVRTLIEFFEIAREEGANFAITGIPGAGKTFTSEYYASMHRKGAVYHIACSEYWNKKIFLSQILEKMGLSNTGYNVGEMMSAIVTHLRRQYQPLLIIDEIDKVSDNVLYFYITLYNELKGLCGIVLLGTDYLIKRIQRGVIRNTKGFKEIYSRIGSKFITLDGTDVAEVAEICKAHGIADQADITEIYNTYNGDLRAIDRQILKRRMHARRGTKLHAIKH